MPRERPPEFDPYSVLGVSHGATAAEIRRAYLSLSRLVHPDRFDAQRQPREWAEANTTFARINGAYEILRDPERRAAYDGMRQPRQPPTESEPRSDAPRPPSESPRESNSSSAPKWLAPALGLALAAGLAFWLVSIPLPGASPIRANASGPQANPSPRESELLRRVDSVLALEGRLASDSSDPLAGYSPDWRTVRPTQPLPVNGETRRLSRSKGLAPLEIRTKGDEAHYLIKLSDWQTDEPVITVFVRGGMDAEVTVPLGSYRLKYASGGHWLGYDLLFGPETLYSKAAERFDFRDTGDAYSGYTVELIQRVGGNLETTRIPPEQW